MEKRGFHSDGPGGTPCKLCGPSPRGPSPAAVHAGHGPAPESKMGEPVREVPCATVRSLCSQAAGSACAFSELQ